MYRKKTLEFELKTTSNASSNDSKLSSIEQKLSAAPRTSTGKKISTGKFVELKRNKNDSKVSHQTRVTRMFQSINVNRPRKSIIVRPVLRFNPSYRLESSNPFNPRAVEDLLKKIIESQMESHEKIMLNHKNAVEMCRSLSEEVLHQVKAKNYDRYRILVNVTAGEKFHQSFRQNVMVLWDNEKDALANYVHESPDMFIITSVYGVYYD